ncbi:MAG TPA: TetR/AcrR family transcriptional regulator [Acidimicrobiales bacterium]|jgi:AcrR family transcriptional regulator|nr:TetR/AcrR family transcriptional regulator [Acidimicrobiales bacterium]
MATTQGLSEAEAAGVPSPEAGNGDGERPKRADARRNRELLITAARTVFGDQGAGAPMEAIAKEAGVGVGTLYRHFPNRLDLVEAVYETDVQVLAATARQVVAELEPGPAVDAFFDAFVRYARTKQALLGELQQAFEKHPDLRSRCRDLIEFSFDLVIERAKEAGAIRTDISGSDVMSLVAPVCTNSSISADQAERLTGMILDGLRVGATATATATATPAATPTVAAPASA